MRISDWSSDVCSSDLATGSFETAVARAEASLGMFVVSSDPRDGTRYYDEWLKAGRLLIRVTQLTADNPRQRQPITELKALYRKRGEELARPANLATYRSAEHTSELQSLMRRSYAV